MITITALCILIFVVANVMIGLYLFGDKIADPENMSAYWVMVALVSGFGLVDGAMSTYFGCSRYYCANKTRPRGAEVPEMEMKQISSSSSTSSPPPEVSSKKIPSPVSLAITLNLCKKSQHSDSQHTCPWSH